MVYIFDFNGTLTTLVDPCQFMRDMRAQEPEATFLLWTGDSEPAIERDFPGLTGLFHARILKPSPLPLPLYILGLGYIPSKVVIVDDSAATRRVTVREGLSMDDCEWVVLSESDLPGLLT